MFCFNKFNENHSALLPCYAVFLRNMEEATHFVLNLFAVLKPFLVAIDMLADYGCTFYKMNLT